MRAWPVARSIFDAPYVNVREANERTTSWISPDQNSEFFVFGFTKNLKYKVKPFIQCMSDLMSMEMELEINNLFFFISHIFLNIQYLEKPIDSGKIEC